MKAAPDDALAWARLAETRLVQGDIARANRAAERAVALDPDSARAQTVAGLRAISPGSTCAGRRRLRPGARRSTPSTRRRTSAWASRPSGAGDLAAGREQIELAVALDPDNALLRTYLGGLHGGAGKVGGRRAGDGGALDPNDPTPWFYDGLRKDRDNRPGLALDDVERAMALSEARGVYRSQNLLGQDEASRGAGLAQIYTDLGFEASGRNVAGLALAQDPRAGPRTASSPTSTAASRATSWRGRASCSRPSSSSRSRPSRCSRP